MLLVHVIIIQKYPNTYYHGIISAVATVLRFLNIEMVKLQNKRLSYIY